MTGRGPDAEETTGAGEKFLVRPVIQGPFEAGGRLTARPVEVC